MKEYKIWKRVAICGLLVSLVSLFALIIWITINSYWVYGLFVLMGAVLGAVMFSLWEVVRPSKWIFFEEVEDDDENDDDQ